MLIDKVDGQWTVIDTGEEFTPERCPECGQVVICQRCFVHLATRFGKQADLFGHNGGVV